MQASELYEGQHYINGQWHPGQGESFYSIDPAKGETLWRGCMASENEIRQAVHAAQQAFPQWALVSFDERATIVKKFAHIVEQKKDQLAELISCENGKPLWESRTEVSAVIGKVALSIAAYQERSGEKQDKISGVANWLRYKPHGVVAVLGAYNFPAHLSNGHIVPALLAGNTVILKPSELTPAVSQFILACWHEAGIPAGVLNGVQGGSQTGRDLLNQDIQGVFFTGSYATGKRIHQHFGGRPEVILALEMGGNNPLIIDEVSNMDAAVYHTVVSSMISSGQRCTCARRLLIPNNAFGQEFLSQLSKACQQLRVGAWDSQPEPFMGPIIRADHAQRHLQAQEQLLQQGGEPVLKMAQKYPNSAFLSPGIIDMSSVAPHNDEEIFAPLLQVWRYQNFDEAIKRANDTRYGLSAGLLSDSEAHYRQFFAHVRAGLINWNRPTTGAAGNLPFGGVGQSGNHRPSAWFAADYCAYPIASVEATSLTLPEQPMPGIAMDDH
ncbi:MAG: succinylglutamate-semialdehyde dehydrogenase [Legionellaceae bacterium]|nr:succinylglutamate-semialdehyde dehydrogenase [Legionellaceae bacterium]